MTPNDAKEEKKCRDCGNIRAVFVETRVGPLCSNCSEAFISDVPKCVDVEIEAEKIVVGYRIPEALECPGFTGNELNLYSGIIDLCRRVADEARNEDQKKFYQVYFRVNSLLGYLNSINWDGSENSESWLNELESKYKAQSAAFKAREEEFNRANKYLAKEKQRNSALELKVKELETEIARLKKYYLTTIAPEELRK